MIRSERDLLPPSLRQLADQADDPTASWIALALAMAGQLTGVGVTEQDLADPTVGYRSTLH